MCPCLCQNSMSSSTEEWSPVPVIWANLVLGEDQSGRDCDSGIASLMSHSFIVKVSALGGQEIQQSRAWRVLNEARAWRADNVFPTSPGLPLSPSPYPLKSEQNSKGLSRDKVLEPPGNTTLSSVPSCFSPVSLQSPEACICHQFIIILIKATSP